MGITWRLVRVDFISLAKKLHDICREQALRSSTEDELLFRLSTGG